MTTNDFAGCTASSQYINQVIYQLKLTGVEQDKIAAMTKVTEINSDHRISFNQLLQQLHDFKQLSHDPLLFIKSGLNISASDYGLLGLVANASENLLQALKNTYKYQSLATDAFHRQAVIEQGKLMNRVTGRHSDPELVADFIELAFSSLVSLCRSLTGNLFNDIKAEIHFQHAPRTSPENYQKVLNLEVKFNQSHNQLIAPAEILQLPIKGHAPSIRDSLIEQLANKYQHHKDSTSMSLRIEHHLVSLLPDQIPSLNQLAETMNTSASTIKRKLKQENSHYKALCNNVRFNHAKVLLTEKDQDILDTAIAIGYGDRASFEKAFKKHCGLSPYQFKKSFLAEHL